MLRIYPVELSRVELCRCSVMCTHPSAVVTQFAILQPTCYWRRKLETGSWLATAVFTPATRRNSTSLSANCSDSLRLLPTSWEFKTHRRRNSTRQLSWVGVGGVYWALGVKPTPKPVGWNPHAAHFYTRDLTLKLLWPELLNLTR